MEQTGALDIVAEQLFEIAGVLHRDIFKRKDGHGEFEKAGQAAVLFALEKEGKKQMSELGRLLCVSKPNITFLVNRLAEEGLIARCEDESDRRVIKVEITAKGKEYIENKKQQLLERIKMRIAGLEESDLAELHASLAKILAIFGKIKKES
ncbi:MarR family winged helix-turn-helix transcriptional regulator [Zhaonella formicivorans]|uniref:MarR family winged helix-turn-helix transcriptional regulator n=1 Tax=Zhaonella formicivorans TaxID=2528593 RepID=UPI0010EAACDF|nr:MarR family transcriptional regulator [Zhaonella formicivorans]